MRPKGFAMMWAGFFLPLLGLCGISPTVLGQVAPSDIVGVSGPLIVTRSGDIVVGSLMAPENTCCVDPQTSWCLAGNIFASAGGGSARAAGINGTQVLSTSGDEYQITVSTCAVLSAYVAYNVWTYTNVTPMPSEEFIAYGASGGRYSYAVTSQGRIFRRLMTGCDPTCIWVYSGEVNAPTPAQRESFGGLKAKYLGER